MLKLEAESSIKAVTHRAWHYDLMAEPSPGMHQDPVWAPVHIDAFSISAHTGVYKSAYSF